MNSCKHQLTNYLIFFDIVWMALVCVELCCRNIVADMK